MWDTDGVKNVTIMPLPLQAGARDMYMHGRPVAVGMGDSGAAMLVVEDSDTEWLLTVIQYAAPVHDADECIGIVPGPYGPMVAVYVRPAASKG